MKKIGITGWKTGENSFGVTLPYLHMFSNYGQVEILTPSDKIRTDIDLVILPGGMDLYSHSYGEVPGFRNSNPDLFKQYFFDVNLDQYVKANVPIFGICLGFQQLAVKFGGVLIQHKDTCYSKERWDAVEEIKTTKGHKKVNSLHHQCIYFPGETSQLDIIAVSKDFGNVEAFKHKTLPIAGVQYHPEELNYDQISHELIVELLK